MTAKRFTIDKKGGVFYLFDNGDLILISDGQPVCDLLNELHEENKTFREALQELKEIGDYQAMRIKEFDNENQKLKKENERLKSFIKTLASPDNRIWLANGYGYRIDKILKGDVE